MLSINDDEIKQFESDLKTFARKAYPFATRNTINTAAFKARGFAQENIDKQMITRNRFTMRSVQVDKARGLNVGRQEATVGSIADYMEDQEFGATKSKRGGEGVPIPTTVASGEGEGTRPRRRLPRVPNRLQSIRLGRNKTKTQTRGQRNFIAVKQAAKSGRKFIFLDLQKHPGIYRVTGGKRRPKVKLIWDMSKASVNIPANPWLAPAVKKTEKLIPEIHRDSLVFQLKRQGLFRSR